MRSYKLDEFTAHTSAVNCLKIGRKSCGVLVTGGEDKKVNVWAIGKPNAILSLSGQQSAVECVNFDQHEEIVAGGGQNGTIKLWDLGSSKVVRTLTGHRSSCLCLEFHPFGDFLASGSLDTNLKVWDLRRKDCIQTYKGHKRGVKRMAISPDGKWVVSGCEGGEVKVWDLSNGRLLHSFNAHDQEITGVELHPTECMMATSSTDKTVRVWELDNWRMLDSIGPEAQPVRAIHFHPGGKQLLAATPDSVKVWGWEPVKHHDTVSVDWPKLADMAIYQHRLVGCSFSGSVVGVYVADLTRVAPFARPPAPAPPVVQQQRAQLPPSSAREATAAATAGARVAGAGVVARAGARPPPDAPAGTLPAVVGDGGGAGGVNGGSGFGRQPSEPLPGHEARRVPGAARAHSLGERHSGVGADPGIGDVWEPASGGAAGRLSRQRTPPLDEFARNAAPGVEVRAPAKPLMVSAATSVGESLTRGQAAELQAPQQQRQQQAGRRMEGDGGRDRRGSVGAAYEPVGLPPTPPGPSARNAAGSGGTRHAGVPAAASQQQRQPSGEAAQGAQDPILAAAAARPGLRADLSRRLSALQVARGFLARGNVEGALRSMLAGSGDSAGAVMLLEALQARKDAFDVASVEPLVKVVELALCAAGAGDLHGQHAADVALSALALVLHGPGQVIRETCSAAPGPGVDLSFEQRHNRCMVAKLALQGTSLKLGLLTRAGGPLAARAQQLVTEVQSLG